MTLPQPYRSNCLLWAFCVKHLFGGSIARRWSLNYRGPHWFWVAADRSEAWGYSPIKPKYPPYDILWFRGQIRRERPC